MVSEFSTFGSCSSRNIFYSRLNENYKQYFHINHCIEFVNIVSLMSSPVEYDDKLINSISDYSNSCIKEDLNKGFLDFLKNDEVIEYLIIDTFYDVEVSNLIASENSFITETARFKKTDFYDTVKDYDRISIQENFDEYFELCKMAYEDFFNFMKTNCPDIKIILNCSRSVYRMLNENNEIVENKKLKRKSVDNRYRNIIDSYLLENYDIDVLPFDDDILANPNHIFGIHQTHYETRYYEEKTEQLNEIISRDSQLGFDSELNIKIRRLRRENQIHKMESINSRMEFEEYKTKKNRQYKKLQSELDSVLNSTSWKVTKPLRQFKYFFKRFKK